MPDLTQNETPRQPHQQLAHWATHTPNAIALSDGEHDLTYRQLYIKVNQMATLLAQRGVRAGQVAVTVLAPRFDYVVTLALMSLGVASCSNNRDGYKGLIGKADWFIMPPSAGATEVVPGENTILLDRAFGMKSDGIAEFIKPTGFASDDLFRLVLTSGTTGSSKAAMFNFAEFEKRIGVRVEELAAFDTSLTLMGFASAGGIQNAMANLRLGKPNLLQNPTKAETQMRLARKFKVGFVLGSPAQLANFVTLVGRDLSGLEGIKFVRTGGTSISDILAQKITKTLGVPIEYALGSTEGNRVSSRIYKPGSDPQDTGEICADVEVQILDDAGAQASIGQVGIVRYKTPYLISGYFGNPEATANSFKDGWFYPGDLGRIDERNHLFIVGRTAEMINAGGVKISPADVDVWAEKQIGVEDCASFAAVDANGITRVWLAVAAGEGFDSQKILADAKDQIRAIAPTQIVVVKAIPRNEMGKPMRGELTAQFSAK